MEAGWPEGTEAGPELPADQQASGAMRSWLVRGTRKFAIDPRRRLGRHGQSRQLLADEGAKSSSSYGTWQDLVAALQRQAVHSALAQLRRADRQILTLAYLQGRTNGEIAAMLGVSVSTVRRRITAALSSLDEHVRKARIWVSSLPVFFLLHGRSLRWPGGVATAATATAAAVTIGLVAIGPESRQTSPASQAPVTESISNLPAWPAIVLKTHARPTSVVVAPKKTQSTSQATDSDASCRGAQSSNKTHKSHVGQGDCKPAATAERDSPESEDEA